MINNLDSIVGQIDSHFKVNCVEMDFENDSWIANIPSKISGWYLIKTDTPLKVLKSIGLPINNAHINIPKTINDISALDNLGITIRQQDIEEYIIYSGEAHDLKARAREHMRGPKGTFCLGLSHYKPLREYKWSFCYVSVSAIGGFGSKDKPLRIAVEQAWRAKHGWPILCRR